MPSTAHGRRSSARAQRSPASPFSTASRSPSSRCEQRTGLGETPLSCSRSAPKASRSREGGGPRPTRQGARKPSGLPNADRRRVLLFLASAEELLRGPAHHPALLGRLDYSHPVMEQNPARVTPRRDRIFPRFLYTPAYRPSLALFFCFPVFPQRQ